VVIDHNAPAEIARDVRIELKVEIVPLADHV
jgi:hypothetical protein